jgi:hypothetical protein
MAKKRKSSRKQSKLRRKGRVTARKFKKFAKTRKGKIIIAGGAAIGLYFLLRGTGGEPGAQVSLSEKLAPVPVSAGELLNATSYRIIANRRSGMTYDAAEGTPGGVMAFTASKDGMFTRNFVSEGDALWAEIN